MRSVGVCSAYPSFDKPFLKVYADERRFIKILDVIIKDNIRINDRVVPGLLRKLEAVVVERRKEAEEEREARAEKMRSNPAAEKNGRFVSEGEIQKAKSYPISRILGNKKLVFCPLHKDDVPSLSINHQKNLWRCFGCGKGRECNTACHGNGGD